ncbi:MAG: Hsp70 family protein [Pseudonocardiaceae bacterium]
MGYWLGIDMGTTFTTAAICREDAGRRALPELVWLGSRSVAVSSVVYLGLDGQVLVGEAAERHSVRNPDRVVRGLTRRLGDGVPMLIGGVPHSAPEIAARVVGWVVDRVAQREGGPAQGITITHPAGWSADKIQTVADALRAADLPEVMFCTEPHAAAASYSIRERIGTGSTIAVYDLGGGTFDAAVVRKTGARTFSVLGIPERIERLGGADFDDAVFGHVVAAVPALSELAATDRVQRSVTLCQRECTEAKEALSASTEVTIPVLLPEVQSQVRLVRSEFEDLIRPQVAQTVEALRRALRSADVRPADLEEVLLIGGSSRIPLVAQLVSAELGRPVTVDAAPHTAIALGAALSGLPADIVHAADIDAAGADVRPGIPTTIWAGRPAVPEPARTADPPLPSVTAIPWHVDVAEVPQRRAPSRRFKQFAAAGVLVLAGGAASVPLVISHSSSRTPAVARIPAPAAPVTTPAPVTPNLGNDDSPRNPDNTAADSTIPTVAPNQPPAPNQPADGTAIPGGTAPEAATVPAPQTPRPTSKGRTPNRSTPPPPAAPPPPTTTYKKWVQSARDGLS